MSTEKEILTILTEAYLLKILTLLKYMDVLRRQLILALIHAREEAGEETSTQVEQ